MSDELNQLREELAATQYWLRVLFGLTSSNRSADAVMIQEHITDMKNFTPPDHWNPSLYDANVSMRIPHIERIGNNIAETLTHRPGR